MSMYFAATLSEEIPLDSGPASSHVAWEAHRYQAARVDREPINFVRAALEVEF